MGEIKYPHSVSTFAGNENVNSDIDRTIDLWRKNLAAFGGNHLSLQQELADLWTLNGPPYEPPSLRAIPIFQEHGYRWDMSLQAFLIAHPVADAETEIIKRAMQGAYEEKNPDLENGETWLAHILALRRYPPPALTKDHCALPVDIPIANLMINAIDAVTLDLPEPTTEAYSYFYGIYDRIATAIAEEVDNSFSFQTKIECGGAFFPASMRNIFSPIVKGLPDAAIGHDAGTFEDLRHRFAEVKRKLTGTILFLSPLICDLMQGDEDITSAKKDYFTRPLYMLAVDAVTRSQNQKEPARIAAIVGALKKAGFNPANPAAGLH